MWRIHICGGYVSHMWRIHNRYPPCIIELSQRDKMYRSKQAACNECHGSTSAIEGITWIQRGERWGRLGREKEGIGTDARKKAVWVLVMWHWIGTHLSEPRIHLLKLGRWDHWMISYPMVLGWYHAQWVSKLESQLMTFHSITHGPCSPEPFLFSFTTYVWKFIASDKWTWLAWRERTYVQQRRKLRWIYQYWGVLGTPSLAPYPSE